MKQLKQLIELKPARPEDEYENHEYTPRCLDCGNTKRFAQVVYETAYGTEYDLECLDCGSLEIEPP